MSKPMAATARIASTTQTHVGVLPVDSELEVVVAGTNTFRVVVCSTVSVVKAVVAGSVVVCSTVSVVVAVSVVVVSAAPPTPIPTESNTPAANNAARAINFIGTNLSGPSAPPRRTNGVIRVAVVGVRSTGGAGTEAFVGRRDGRGARRRGDGARGAARARRAARCRRAPRSAGVDSRHAERARARRACAAAVPARLAVSNRAGDPGAARHTQPLVVRAQPACPAEWSARLDPRR